MQNFYNSLVQTPQTEQSQAALLARLTKLDPSHLNRFATRFVWNPWT